MTHPPITDDMIERVTNECFDCGKTFTSFLEMHVCHDCARERRIERAKKRCAALSGKEE